MLTYHICRNVEIYILHVHFAHNSSYLYGGEEERAKYTTIKGKS